MTELVRTESDIQLSAFPWRIYLAGGCFDQPWVSKIKAGSVIVVNVSRMNVLRTDMPKLSPRNAADPSAHDVQDSFGTRDQHAPGTVMMPPYHFTQKSAISSSLPGWHGALGPARPA